MKLREILSKNIKQVRGVRFTAPFCPHCKRNATRVLSTDKRVRYCCCDSCGHGADYGWKVEGEPSNPALDLISGLFETLRDGDIVKTEQSEEQMLVVSVAEVKPLVERCAELIPKRVSVNSLH